MLSTSLVASFGSTPPQTPACLPASLLAEDRWAFSPGRKRQPEQVAAVLRELAQCPVPYLVAFDNVEEVALLREWLARLQGAEGACADYVAQPGMGRGPRHRLPAWLCPPFLSRRGRELLRRLVPRLVAVPDGLLDKLTTKLGGLPLALDLAGHYLKLRRRLTIEAYLDELDKVSNTIEHRAFTGVVNEKDVEHYTSLQECFEVSYRRLDPVKDALALRFFHAAGYLAPDVAYPR